MIFIKAFFAAALVTLTTSFPLKDQTNHSPGFGAHKLFENTIAPSGWTSVGSPLPDATITMHIALKQTNITALRVKLLEISNPAHTNYGQWLSRHEIEAFTTPSANTIQIVQSWLAHHNVSAKTVQPDWLEIIVPVSHAESMLNTTYASFQHINGRIVHRALSYSLPKSLHEHIVTIQPTTAFIANGVRPHLAPVEPATALSSRNDACYTKDIVPSCIRSYYNVDYNSKGKAPMAVHGFGPNSASHHDAQHFIREFDPTRFSNETDFIDIGFSGDGNTGESSDEGNLDTQYAMSLAFPNPVIFYSAEKERSSGLLTFTDSLTSLLNGLANSSEHSSNPLPTVLSISYGANENSLSPSYMTSVCNEFMKLTARGVSILVAAGDNGVAGQDIACSASLGGYQVIFPASCPYVTAVGATQFTAEGEEEASRFGGINDGRLSTGGGFSSQFEIPDYQTPFLQSYANANLNVSYVPYIHSAGRGVPDVALIGNNFTIILNGTTQTVFGTSASSPSFGALISLLNDYRISQGNAILGFLNPLLYSPLGRSALKDITSGNNPGCGTQGYPAAVGWDPLTGLGTMNFTKMRQIL